MRFPQALLVFVLLLAGCTTPQPVEPEPDPITFTDDLGREITLDGQPESVASMIGSFSDIWVDAGGKDTLTAAAHDTFTSFDLDLEDVADLGAIKNPDLEVLASVSPDLVLASAKNEEQKALEKTLTDMDIPIAYFDVSNFDDYLRTLETFTLLTGDETAYETYGTSQKEQIDALVEKAAQEYSPIVLYLRATGKGVTAMTSEGSVLGEMLADLNTDNIADSYQKLQSDLSMETIYLAAPEMIFLVVQGSDPADAQANLDKYLNNPVWKQLDAVQNGHVYVLDQDLYNLKPNARWAEAYQNLYEILYS